MASLQLPRSTQTTVRVPQCVPFHPSASRLVTETAFAGSSSKARSRANSAPASSPATSASSPGGSKRSSTTRSSLPTSPPTRRLALPGHPGRSTASTSTRARFCLPMSCLRRCVLAPAILDHALMVSGRAGRGCSRGDRTHRAIPARYSLLPQRVGRSLPFDRVAVLTLCCA